MDILLSALADLLRIPYELWKGSIENSRVGPSEWDLETLRFWKRVAVVGTGILLCVALGAKVFLGLFA